MRHLTLAGAMLLSAVSLAQTPPIRPITPDVPAFEKWIFPELRDLAVKPLSVEDAVDIALRRQSGLLITKERWNAARGREVQARSELLPHFSIGYSGSDIQTLKGEQAAGGSGLGFRSNGTATVSQLLYDFGRTRSIVRQLSNLARAAEHDYSQARQEVAASVRSAFFEFRRAQELERASEANLSNRNAQLALADARLMSGLGAPSDLVRAKTSVAEASIALANARSAAVAARLELAVNLGIDPRTPLSLDDSTLESLEIEIATMIEKALKDRPEMKSLLASVAAGEHSLSAARQSNAPTISFNANLSTRGGNDPLTNQTSSVGLSVNWLIGDGGAGRGRVSEARANLNGTRAQLNQIQQAIAAEVIGAASLLTQAEQRLTIAKIQLENARELVRISEGRYRGGIGTFLELVDAQDSLFAAERNVSNASADVQSGIAALKRAIGETV